MSMIETAFITIPVRTEEQTINAVLNVDGSPKIGVSTGVQRLQLQSLLNTGLEIHSTVRVQYLSLGFIDLFEGHTVWTRKSVLGTAVGIRQVSRTLFGRPMDREWAIRNTGRLHVIWIPRDPTANGGFIL